MISRLVAAAALLAAALFAVPAAAADPPITSLPFSAGGTTYQEGTYSDGTHFFVDHMVGGWTGSAWKPWTMDANGYGGVNVLNTPTFNIGTLGNAASATLQGTANGYLQTLATGALTKVDSSGFQYVSQGDQTGSSSLTLNTLGQVVTISLSNARGTVGTNISGLSGTGATLTAESQNGPSAPWVASSVISPGAVATSTVTTDGNYSFDAGGHYAVRFRVSVAAGAGATATVAYDATASTGIVRETNSAGILAAAQTTATNTTPSGSGAMTVVPGATTNGTALGCSVAPFKGVRLYLASSDAVTFTIAKTAPSAAPTATYTASGASAGTGPNWDENLQGADLYVTAKSGAPVYRCY